MSGRVQSQSRLGVWARVGNWPFLMVIYLYRSTLSHFIGGQCRFEPTCSRYGIDAYKIYGPIRGTKMTVTRILRCHPFSKGGYDPVPIPSDGKDDRAHADGCSQDGTNESERD